MRFQLLTTLFLLAGTFQAFSQSHEGTEFWLGFMEHRDIQLNTKVVMITSDVNTQGRVEMPHQGWSEPFTVTAGSVSIVTLPKSSETLGSERVDNTGILITSEDPVVVYAHQYHNARSEASLILPVQALGNEYYIMSYWGFYDNQGVDYPSELLVVAQEDQTEIEVDLTGESVGGVPAGNTIRVTLDRGESYQVQAANGDAGDVTGSWQPRTTRRYTGIMFPWRP